MLPCRPGLHSYPPHPKPTPSSAGTVRGGFLFSLSTRWCVPWESMKQSPLRSPVRCPCPLSPPPLPYFILNCGLDCFNSRCPAIFVWLLILGQHERVKTKVVRVQTCWKPVTEFLGEDPNSASSEAWTLPLLRPQPHHLTLFSWKPRVCVLRSRASGFLRDHPSHLTKVLQMPTSAWVTYPTLPS